jgi:hypothetical protein
MCEGCAYHVDNWIYGYQVYCTHPTEYWINPLGLVLIVVLLGVLFTFISRRTIRRRLKNEKRKN